MRIPKKIGFASAVFTALLAGFCVYGMSKVFLAVLDWTVDWRIKLAVDGVMAAVIVRAAVAVYRLDKKGKEMKKRLKDEGPVLVFHSRTHLVCYIGSLAGVVASAIQLFGILVFGWEMNWYLFAALAAGAILSGVLLKRHRRLFAAGMGTTADVLDELVDEEIARLRADQDGGSTREERVQGEVDSVDWDTVVDDLKSGRIPPHSECRRVDFTSSVGTTADGLAVFSVEFPANLFTQSVKAALGAYLEAGLPVVGNQPANERAYGPMVHSAMASCITDGLLAVVREELNAASS